MHDRDGRNAPTGLTCALFPLTLHTGQTAAVGAGVSAGLLGTVPDPGGGRVVTYHGWPLYTYLGDASPGHAAGQGKNDDGGYWYVMRPSGQIVSP
jgi:predicted lipoprotein with Yx(FWY)xxD motif